MAEPEAPSIELPFDFRRGIDLRLDTDGRWFHDGEPFLHAGLISLFNRGIDLSPDTGEPIVRVGSHWAYFRCDDVPFIVRTCRVADGALDVLLNTERTVRIAVDALRASAEGVLYAELGAGRRARFGRSAQATLAEHLTDDGPGGYAVVIGPTRVPIAPLLL
jgi:hypothetical protein